ncbi:MAG: hypothetical protein JWN04_1004 [Myxococcaceae bacterium]|nr:hypothetical protein [Myxococcaceae bacterium]
MTVCSGQPPGSGAGLAVGICTYKRPAGLRRALRHLREAIAIAPMAVSVVVVDNDGQDAAVEDVVRAELGNVSYRYVIERRPGISAARNAIVRAADELSVRYLAMLDDDEWPTERWLVELLAVTESEGVAVVGGPVSPVFPADVASKLMRWERYWSVEPQLLDGKPFVFCTCNFLVDLARLEEVARPFFDEEFGLSGGGDTAFFRKLFVLGIPMGWAKEANLFEEVPRTRATIQWLRQRKYRVGNHAVRWELVGANPLAIAAKTVALGIRLAIYPLLGRDRGTPLMGWMLEAEKVRGRFAAHLGQHFLEYGRGKNAPGEKACR